MTDELTASFRRRVLHKNYPPCVFSKFRTHYTSDGGKVTGICDGGDVPFDTRGL